MQALPAGASSHTVCLITRLPACHRKAACVPALPACLSQALRQDLEKARSNPYSGNGMTAGMEAAPTPPLSMVQIPTYDLWIDVQDACDSIAKVVKYLRPEWAEETLVTKVRFLNCFGFQGKREKNTARYTGDVVYCRVVSLLTCC